MVTLVVWTQHSFALAHWLDGMPFYGYRRRFNRRKRQRAPQPIVRVSRGGPDQIIPDRWMCKLKFVDMFISGSSATSFFNFSWQLNSPFDATTGGPVDKAFQFPQMALLYQNYVVFGAKVDLLVVSNNASDTFFYGIFPTFDADPFVQNVPGMENRGLQKYGQSGFLLSAVNTQTKPMRYKRYIPCNQMFSGGLDAWTGRTGFSSTTIGSPANILELFVVFLNSLGAVGATAGLFFRMKITFYTTFFERQLLPQTSV